MQDSKSLYVAVTICGTMVNIQTDRYIGRKTDNILTSLYEKFSQLS